MRIPLAVARAVVLAGSRPLGPPVPLGVQRAWVEAQSRLAVLPAGTTVDAEQLGGRPAERVAAPGTDDARAVLLLHGGAFLVGSPRSHRVLAAHLSAAVGCPVHVLDYRRAPEHPYPAAVDDADTALDELLDGRSVAVVGDSAGGALTLLLALRRRDAGRALPAALGLVSPVTDLTGETSAGYDGPDPVLRQSWVERGTAAFVGAADARALSPLHADLHGLPPVVLQVATDERLRREGEQLGRRLRAAGVAVGLDVLAGLWHDVHLQASFVPEGAEATRRLGRALRAAWDAR